MESFSTKKKFYDLKCAEKQNQIQGCKATHRAGTTNTCAGTHTHTADQKEMLSDKTYQSHRDRTQRE